jgi:hypothetical protein
MINSWTRTAFSIVFCGALPAAAASLPRGAAATVNGRPILDSDLRREEESALEDRRGALDRLIDLELLVQQAAREHLVVRARELDVAVDAVKARFKTGDDGRAVDDATADRSFSAELKKQGLDLAQFRRNLERQLLARAVIQRDVRAGAPDPTEQDIEAGRNPDAAVQRKYDEYVKTLRDKAVIERRRPDHS